MSKIKAHNYFVQKHHGKRDIFQAKIYHATRQSKACAFNAKRQCLYHPHTNGNIMASYLELRNIIVGKWLLKQDTCLFVCWQDFAVINSFITTSEISTSSSLSPHPFKQKKVFTLTSTNSRFKLKLSIKVA